MPLTGPRGADRQSGMSLDCSCSRGLGHKGGVGHPATYSMDRDRATPPSGEGRESRPS